MAQMGQIGRKLDDEQLKQLLESLKSQLPKSSMIKFARRRAAIDDSEMILKCKLFALEDPFLIVNRLTLHICIITNKTA